MSAQEDLERLEREMLVDAARIERRELTANDVSAWLLPEYTAKIAAIREGLGKAQEPDGFLHDDGYYTLSKKNGRVSDGLQYAGASKVAFYLAHTAASAQALVDALPAWARDMSQMEAVAVELENQGWVPDRCGDPECVNQAAGMGAEVFRAIIAAHKSEVKG